jgi:hypothetical protein
LWPKLAGSTWSGQINAEESIEGGTSGFVFDLTIVVKSDNTIAGGFEFPMAHSEQGPVRQQITCTGNYDPSTGKIALTFEKSYTRNEPGTVLPVVTTVKVTGTMKGGVEPDPNHHDLAQGEFRGSRVVQATMSGGKPVTTTGHLTGSWRLQRR